MITEIGTVTREDELEVKVEFRLLPSKTAFSRLTAELFFNGEKLYIRRLRALQGPLARDDSEFTSVLDMKRIGAGCHVIKVELCELWGSEEKLRCTSKEVTIEYVPLRREDRLIKIPIVKSVAGADLAVMSDSDRDIYREIDEEMKKKLSSQRDEW